MSNSPPNSYYEAENATMDRTSFTAATSSPKAITPPTGNHSKEVAHAAIEFANLIGQLKNTPRTGWKRRNIVPCESVADHSWRVAMLAFLLLESNTPTTPSATNPCTSPLYFDIGKVIQIALIHDVAECIVGDITPEDNVSKDEKHQLEYNAMLQITKLLHSATMMVSMIQENGHVSSTESSIIGLKDNPLMKLFHEYEERQSTEAIMVKDLDLLDMILQANTYEQQYASTGQHVDLSDFFVGTPPSRFQIPKIRRIAEKIHHQRNDRISNLIQTKAATTTSAATTCTSTTTTAVVSTRVENHTASQVLPLCLSESDLAFVREYTKTLSQSQVAVDSAASTHGNSSVLATVLALRQWEALNQQHQQHQHHVEE